MTASDAMIDAGEPQARDPVGARDAVPLKDGSNVELNTATVLQAAITKQRREIWLEQGPTRPRATPAAGPLST